MFVTFFDTCMVTLASLLVWRLSPFVVFIPWLVFATVDCLYLSSSLNKVPDGAWFTITIAGILTCIFLLWRFGKENQWRAEAEDRFRPAQLLHRENDSVDSPLVLAPRWGGGPVSRIKGLGIYFDKAGVLTPTVFTQFVSKFGTVPDAIIFFHLHPVEAPSVAASNRYAISRIPAVPGCYRLVIRHGYMDEVITPDLAALIYEQVRKFIIRDGSSGEEDARVDEAEEQQNGQATGQTDEETQAKIAARQNGGNRAMLGLDDEATKEELGRLDRAFASKVMYIVGKEQMHIKDNGTSFPRRILLTTFLWIRDNTRAKIANLRLAMDRVVEVGFIKEI